jgi:WD40 repeat protein/beta-lactamase regulating signal transducer with metallopeptidase domain
MSAIEVLNDWGASWVGFMGKSLIDVSVLLVLVTIVWLPLRRRMSAQLAHGLFCLVLVKLIVPAPIAWPEWTPGFSAKAASDWVARWIPPAAEPNVASAPEPFTLPTTGDFEVSVADPSGPLPVVTTGAPTPTVVAPRAARLSVSAWLMIGWGMVSLVLLARFARACLATRRFIQDAVLIGPGSLPVDVEALQRMAGVRSSVRWAMSPILTSPAVGGLVRPTVVIPPDLDDGLTPKQLAWVLLHELAHVRRGDLWVATGQKLMQAVFFFHPAVHLANWIIDQLREYACDDVALAACKTSRLVCGEGFLTVVARSVERAPMASPALGLFESRMLIRRRLLRILDGRRKVHERLSPGATVGLLAAAFVLLPYSRSFEVWGRTQFATSSTALALQSGPDEPATYRPGEVWRPESSGDARSPVLALAYSPDGTTVASASEDGVIRLRNVASSRIVARLVGHKDTICGLAYSPDGKTLVSAGYDRSVKLWDVASGTETASLLGHENWVFAVAFSPDGRYVASAGHDKTVRVWDVARKRGTAVYRDNSASVRALAFSPDGKTVAAGGADRAVTLWTLASGTSRARLEGHKGTIRALAYSPDGSTLATASEDGDLKLWDAASGRERRTLSGHSEMVVCLAFSPKGQTLASGSLDATVKLWDLRSGRERATLQGHSDGVSGVAFAPGARRLATAGFDGTVRVWEPAAPVFSAASCLPFSGHALALTFGQGGRTILAAGKDGDARWDARDASSLPALTDHAGAVSLAVGPGGDTLITGQSDGTVRMAGVVSGKVVAEVQGQGGSAQSVAASPDGRFLASAGADGAVRIFQAESRRLIHEFPASGASAPVRLLKFSRDGRILAAAADEVVLWEVATGRELGRLRGHGSGVSSVAFSPDRRTIATAGLDGVVKLWNAETLALGHDLKYDACLSAEFSPDGRLLVTSHEDGNVVLWDAHDGRQLGVLKGHRGAVSHATFAPGGRTLATAGEDGSVKLWNLAALRHASRATLKGDIADAWAVAYSPDGSTLAVADSSGTITLWNTSTKRVKATLEGHDRIVVKLAFSPDGKTLASGSCEGTVKIWDVPTGAERYALSSLNGLTDLAFSPDGATLATAGEGKFVTLWDVKQGEEIARLSDHQKKVQCIAFSPDGSKLVAGGGELRNAPDAPGELTVWDVASRSVVARFDGHARTVLALAFSPDGRSLAAAGFDQPVRVWDITTGRSKLTLGGLTAYVQSLAFSRDGRMLAWSGRGDGLVSLHEASTGAEITRLVGHHALVRDLAFSPDGNGLATASADKTVKLWDLP